MTRICARAGILGSMVALGLALGTMGCEPEQPAAEERGFTQAKLQGPQFRTIAPLSSGRTLAAHQGQRGSIFGVVRDGERDVGGFSVIPYQTGETFLTALNDGSGSRAIFDARTGRLISGSLVDRRATPFGDGMLGDLNGLGLRLQGSTLPSSTVGCSGNMLSGLGRGLGALFGIGGMFGLDALGGAFDADCGGPGFDMRSMFGVPGASGDPFGLDFGSGAAGGGLRFFDAPFETAPAATAKKARKATSKGCGSCAGSPKIIKANKKTGAVSFGGTKDDAFPPLPSKGERVPLPEKRPEDPPVPERPDCGGQAQLTCAFDI
jgi:hypothetical protein